MHFLTSSVFSARVCFLSLGLQQIWRVDMNKPDQWVPITFGGSNGGAPDQCYSVYVAANYNYDTTDVRLGFSSFTEPRQVLPNTP